MIIHELKENSSDASGIMSVVIENITPRKISENNAKIEKTIVFLARA